MDDPGGVARAAPPRLLGRAEIVLALAFWSVAGAVTLARGTFLLWLPYALPVAGFVSLWPLVRRARRADVLLDWAPFPLVLLTYDMLHAVVPRTWGWTIDAALRDADRALLGDDLPRLLLPAVGRAPTVAMSIAYATYYVAPVAMGLWWYARGARTAFRELMVGIAGALFVGYLGYLLLPAVGPHVHLAAEGFGAPLDGDFAGTLIRLRNDGHDGYAPRDAFPSLHTANAVTLLLMSWRHERRAFAVVLVPMAALVAATMYLRVHWLVDVLAGAAFALLWQPAAVAIVRRESAPPLRGASSSE